MTLTDFIAALKTAPDDRMLTVEMAGVTYDLEAEELRAAVLDVSVASDDLAMPRLCFFCAPLVAGAGASPAALSAKLSARRRA